MDVRLRDVVEADLPIYFEHQRDPTAVEMPPSPPAPPKRSPPIGRRSSPTPR